MPAAICAVLVLMGMLLAGASVMLDQKESEENTKVRIALVGDLDDPYLQMGLTMLESLDATQYTLEILVTDTQTAAQMLENREINAYVIMPEGFMDNALRGDVVPLEFVSLRDGTDLIAIFKKEMTNVVATMVVESQRCVYGLRSAMRENGLAGIGDTVNDVAMDSIWLLIARDKMYQVQQLGIADGMDLSQTLLSGLSVLLIMLACLPFTALLVRRDTSLNQVIAAKGKPFWLQFLWEFVAYFAALALVCLSALVLCWLATVFGILSVMPIGQLLQMLLYLLPVAFLAASLSFLLCSFTGEVISGVLLQFFVSVAMCFVSGCIYPMDFFPVQLQQMARWLPAGVARTWMSGALTGNTSWAALGLLLGYGAVFAGLSLLFSRANIRRKQR